MFKFQKLYSVTSLPSGNIQLDPSSTYNTSLMVKGENVHSYNTKSPFAGKVTCFHTSATISYTGGRGAKRGGAGGALSLGPQLLEGPIHSQIKKMTKLMKNEWVLHFLIMTLKEELLWLLYVTSFHFISYVYKYNIIYHHFLPLN